MTAAERVRQRAATCFERWVETGDARWLVCLWEIEDLARELEAVP